MKRCLEKMTELAAIQDSRRAILKNTVTRFAGLISFDGLRSIKASLRPDLGVHAAPSVIFPTSRLKRR